MPPISLTPNQIHFLNLSSRSAIESSFQQLYSDIGHGEWLHNNYYTDDTINKIKNNFTNNLSIHNSDICKYIAASAPTHCMDGWGFLGRSVHCIVQGDTNTARHLAYYAELRAAISLLASAGIGIFNNIHVVIDQSGQAHYERLEGTHKATWQVLQHWANTQAAANLIGDIIIVDSIPLRDWLTEFRATGNFTALASHWLTVCGLDLNIFTSDRDARNIVSYRPSHLTRPLRVNALESSEFISDLWTILNPNLTTRFNILDRYLLRKSLQTIDRNIPWSNSDGKNMLYSDRISLMLSRFSFSPERSIGFNEFFIGTNNPDPLILDEAERRQPFNDPRHHFEVISRATLLLRIATGSCFRLIKNASFSSEDLEFWWNSLGIERGFWNNRNKPGTRSGDIVSIWDDVGFALQKLNNWRNKVNHASYSGMIKKQNNSFRVLEGCERIGLWGLIP